MHYVTLFLYADPAKVLNVRAMGNTGILTTGGSKKSTIKQGELVQLVCDVAGYPEPTVQWTRKVMIEVRQQIYRFFNTFI